MKRYKYKTILNFPLVFLIISCLYSCEKFEDYHPSQCESYEVTELIDSSKASIISEIVCNTINDNELIGIQVSITDHLGESWSFSAGASDLKQSKCLENDDLLRIGSVTKIYTATLILKLIEENYFQLDQKLSDYFPDIENVKDVSIKNLLNHSSGITDIFSIPSTFITASEFPDKKWNPSHLAEVCMEKNLKFDPGTEHSYSNTNYIILGLVAEKATGKDIDKLFDEYIFRPLNLENTFFVPYHDTPSRLVNGYVHHFALSLNEWYTTEPENTSWSTLGFSAGAMVTNSAELSAFMKYLFGEEIIQVESLELMTEFVGDKGLGLFKINVNDHHYYGHEGEITGFESICVYNPESEIIISICCNTTPFNITELLNKIDAQL